MRAQANLPALAIALLVVTTSTGLALTLADGAFASGHRDADQRRVAVALSERLVGADSPLTLRANVFDATRIAAVDSGFDDAFPVVGNSAVRVRLDDRTLVDRGEATGGTTIRRVVLVGQRQPVRLTPTLAGNRTTLPRRSERVTITVDADERVRTVRANDRVVLHDPTGLDGTFTVRLSRFATTTLAFETDAPLEPGDVTLIYYPLRTTKATLAVTVR